MKLKNLLYAAVLLPRIAMLDWTQLEGDATEYYVTCTDDKVYYLEIYTEPVVVLDYPCTDEVVPE